MERLKDWYHNTEGEFIFFYIFYLSASIAFEDIKQIIMESLSYEEVIENSNKRLELSTSGFNLSIKEGGDGVRFRCEDYGMDLRFELV